MFVLERDGSCNNVARGVRVMYHQLGLWCFRTWPTCAHHCKTVVKFTCNYLAWSLYSMVVAYICHAVTTGNERRSQVLGEIGNLERFIFLFGVNII